MGTVRCSSWCLSASRSAWTWSRESSARPAGWADSFCRRRLAPSKTPSAPTHRDCCFSRWPSPPAPWPCFSSDPSGPRAGTLTQYNDREFLPLSRRRPRLARTAGGGGVHVLRCNALRAHVLFARRAHVRVRHSTIRSPVGASGVEDPVGHVMPSISGREVVSSARRHSSVQALGGLPEGSRHELSPD